MDKFYICQDEFNPRKCSVIEEWHVNEAIRVWIANNWNESIAVKLFVNLIIGINDTDTLYQHRVNLYCTFDTEFKGYVGGGTQVISKSTH